MHELRCDPFVIFTEDEGEEQGGIDVEAGGAPPVDLAEAFFQPMGFCFSVGRVEPGPELREEVFENVELAAKIKDPRRFTAAEEFLDFFVETR